jgi:hypothetical protein
MFKTFKESYNEFGFNLKIEESYTSESLLGFGKIYLVDQVWQTATIKKGCKIHGLANLLGDLPLEYIKGVYSEAMSTMSYSVNHRYLYILAIVNTLRYLALYDPMFFEMTRIEKIAWFLFPTNFGGSPVLPYIRCLSKGDSDLETIWLSLYIYLRNNYPELFSILKGCLSVTLKQSTNYSALASNCYTLPVISPAGGLRYLQEQIKQCIPEITKNKDFKQVLTKASKRNTRNFIERLYSSSVIPAKAFSVLYETSASGLVEEFVQKFASAKSMLIPLRKAYKGRAYRIIRIARKKDITRLHWIRKVIETHKTMYQNVQVEKILEMGDASQCPTQVSEVLRNYLWKKEIIGITYPCPVNQLQFILPTFEQLRNKGLIHDTFTLWIHPTNKPVNMCYTHGPEEMYLGMHTDLKVLPPPVSISGTSPGLERVEKILKVAPLLSKLGPTVMKYVSTNLQEISGIPGDLLLQCCWKYISGSISHRVPANHWSPIVGPNELPNRTSFVGHKTSTDRGLRSLHGDWTINFGSLLSHEMAVILYATEFNAVKHHPQQTTSAHLHTWGNKL